MAFSEQTATDLNDILDKANTFFAAQGWTVNKYSDDSSKYGGDTFTGKRLHIQKSFSTEDGTVEAYANLRSAEGQNVYAYQGTSSDFEITGIACNCSRGYDGLEGWDTQTDSTNEYTTLSVAGSANLRNASSIKCHFFSGDYSGAIVMEGADQWYAVSFGVTNLGVPFYACGGGSNSNNSSESYAWAKGMMTSNGTSSNPNYYGSALWLEERGKWGRSDSTLTGLRVGGHIAPYGTFAEDLVEATPDQYTGNPLLAPSEFISTESTSVYYPIKGMGNCPDIALVNMSNLEDGDVITISSDDWVCYYVNSDETYGNQWGYAIKK